MQRFLPLLQKHGRGMPPLPVNEFDAPAMFAALPADADPWDEAALKECIVYMRGSKYLSLPQRWREVMPSELSGY